jgi:N-acetyl-1-D-myo-inositol-2-amino-2-deoxy-alpha-D-glucopyranoside deacetylase
MAAYIAAGHRVTLVCATRGEVGEISDPSFATPDTLGYVRELELRAAMAQIHLADVRFLPYRDSGMAGTPENDDPRCLHQQPADAAVPALLEIMREIRPHYVFTWDPDGGYGHPDHVAAHRHTVAAFDACGNPEAYPAAGPAWTPERLYWGARTMKRFAAIFLEMERRGLLPEGIEPERRERFRKAMEEPDVAASLEVDVNILSDLKRKAASMHRSQFGENSVFARIPDDMRQQFYAVERFYQARPEWKDGRQLERSLPGL